MKDANKIAILKQERCEIRKKKQGYVTQLPMGNVTLKTNGHYPLVNLRLLHLGTYLCFLPLSYSILRVYFFPSR